MTETSLVGIIYNMLETPHVVVGAAIATKIANPYLSLPLSFLSHFLLERVPHWNPHLNKEIKEHGHITILSTAIVIGDVAASLILGTYIASLKLPDYGYSATILIACFLSVLPDVVEGPYFFFKMKYPLIIPWIKFQKSLQADTGILLGIATQLITIAAALYWIFT